MKLWPFSDFVTAMLGILAVGFLIFALNYALSAEAPHGLPRLPRLPRLTVQ